MPDGSGRLRNCPLTHTHVDGRRSLAGVREYVSPGWGTRAGGIVKCSNSRAPVSTVTFVSGSRTPLSALRHHFFTPSPASRFLRLLAYFHLFFFFFPSHTLVLPLALILGLRFLDGVAFISIYIYIYAHGKIYMYVHSILGIPRQIERSEIPILPDQTANYVVLYCMSSWNIFSQRRRMLILEIIISQKRLVVKKKISTKRYYFLCLQKLSPTWPYHPDL